MPCTSCLCKCKYAICFYRLCSMECICQDLSYPRISNHLDSSWISSVLVHYLGQAIFTHRRLWFGLVRDFCLSVIWTWYLRSTRCRNHDHILNYWQSRSRFHDSNSTWLFYHQSVERNLDSYLWEYNAQYHLKRPLCSNHLRFWPLDLYRPTSIVYS